MPRDSAACFLAAKLTFKEPDRVKYPCIDLAYAAGRAGGSMTAAMNAANERANEIFRQEAISVKSSIESYLVFSLCRTKIWGFVREFLPILGNLACRWWTYPFVILDIITGYWLRCAHVSTRTTEIGV